MVTACRNVSYTRKIIITLITLVLAGAGIARLLTPTSAIITGPSWIQVIVNAQTHHALVLNDQNLNTVDLVSNKVVNSIPVNPASTISPLDAQNLYAEWHDEQGALSLLDLRNGKALCTFRLFPYVVSDVALDLRAKRSYVFTNTNGAAGPTLSLDLKTCKLGRALTVRPLPTSLTVDSTHHALFVTTATGDVFAIDTRVGYTRRIFHRKGFRLVSSAIDVRFHRLFVAGPRTLLTFDIPTGRYIGATPLSGTDTYFDLHLNQSAQRLYVVDDDSERAVQSVITINTRTGQAISTTTIAAGARDEALGTVAIDSGAGRVYIATPSQNVVSVLDAHDGHVLSTRAVNNPYGVALDGALHKLLVVGIQKSPLAAVGLASGHSSAVYVYDLNGAAI